MSKTICGGTLLNTLAAGATTYLFVGAASVAGAATEAPAQRKMYKAGTFSRLYARISTNTLSGSCTLTFRKNGSNGNSSIVIPAGTTGFFSDVADSDVVAVNDLIDVAAAAAPGTGSIGIVAVWLHFGLAGTDATSLHGCDSTGAAMTTTASATRFIPPCAAIQTAITTEAQAAVPIDVAGTYRNLQCYVISNTRTTATTIQFRKTGGNGNQSISIGAGVTGFLEDSVNTDAVIAGDTIDFEYINGTGVGTITLAFIGIAFDSSVARTSQVFAYQASAVTTAARAASVLGAALSNAAQQLGMLVRATKLRTYLTANTRDETDTISTRIVSTPIGSVGLTIGVTATSTGTFADTTHEDIIAGSDQYQHNRGIIDSVGSYTTAWFSLVLEHLEPTNSQAVVIA